MKAKLGLSNEEVDLADEIVTFPVNPAFASLNIAQAVLLMSYEWRRAAGLSVLAHLEDLVARGVVATDGAPSIAGVYRLGA